MRAVNPPDPRPVHFPPLDPREFAPDPIVQFQRWYAAVESLGLKQPEAMALATATPDGRPSLRWVLLKGVDERGFTFYSNYESRKAGELEANPRAALAFYWESLGRQVRIEGSVARTDPAESDAYFASRPPGSRLGAAASPQSRVLPDRATLEARLEGVRSAHPDGNLPRPDSWGGYRLLPESVEFWQQGTDRLHDRLRYRRHGAGWVLERLAP
jgi:pyridoxamine 5'-phosphate oxidase